MQQKHILFGVLNWGLGHASRSKVLITYLLSLNYEVTMASSGLALTYLRNHFPLLNYLELTNYPVAYAKHKNLWKWTMLLQTKYLYKQYQKDKEITAAFLAQNEVAILISDNLPSVFHYDIPSIYITHQLQLPKGFGSKIGSFLHQKYYQKYSQVWVPDFAETPKLAGKLSAASKHKEKIHYIGLLSDHKLLKQPQKYTCAVILSGPEPQRSILEEKLLGILPQIKGNHILVSGTKSIPTTKKHEGITHINLASSEQIEAILNSAALIICRSGYSSIMDLVSCQTNALLVPTPGQPEQEYIAKNLTNQGFYAVCSQADLSTKAVHEALQLDQKLPKWATLDKVKVKKLLARFH